MQYDDEDMNVADPEIVEDILPGTAVGLAVVQGKMQLTQAPEEFADALEEYGVFDGETMSERVEKFFDAVNYEAGSINMISAILSLMGVGIITVDMAALAKYYELEPKRELN